MPKTAPSMVTPRRARKAREGAAYRFLGDQPYTEPEDPLGHDHLVERLACLIEESRSSTPFVIGVEGPWGAGKSSIMLKLRERLARDGLRTVYYNAWTQEGRRGATEALLKTVLAALDEDILQRWMRFDRNETWKRRSVSLLRIPFVALAARLGLGNAVDKVWDRLEKDVEVANDFHQRFSDAMREWSARNPAGDEPGLLAVFIDDLDRCSDKSVMEILTAVKLYLTVPRCIFVLGYDRMAVDELIHRRIAQSAAVKGSMYLEKMIQVPFSIPQPDCDAAGACLDQYLREAGVAALFAGCEDIIMKSTDANPRRMKRFINVFLLRWLIGEATGTEAPPELLALSLLLNLHDRGFSFLVERDFGVIDRFADYARISRAVDQAPNAALLPAEIRSLITQREYFHLGVDTESREQLRESLRAAFPPSYQGYCQDERLCELVLSLRDAASGVSPETAERVAKASREATERAAEAPPPPGWLPATCKEGLMAMPATFNPRKAAGASAVIQFKVTGPEPGNYYLEVKKGKCTATEGEHASPTLTINTPSDVWLKIMRREVDATTAFMSGTFAFTGDMGTLMQMGSWFESY
ncbi:MAG: P-loop NTPase fold protein [Dehalococcoidia bacterium]|nr:P-loop NTPase fold protein [Dehalococcoidia bacterium]